MIAMKQDQSTQKSEDFLKQAKIHFEKGQYKTALEYLDEHIQLFPKCEEAYFYMGNCFHMLGQVAKAIKAYQKVLEYNPEHTDSSICLSILYNDIGQYAEGKRVFETANRRIRTTGHSPLEDTHINRKFSIKHYELGGLYFSYNRFDEALSEFQKAFQLDPQNLECRVKMAKTLAKKGLVMKAVEDLKSLKSEFPHYYPIRVALGLLYYSMGNVVEAQLEWKFILQKDPKNKEAMMYLSLSSSATETTIPW